MGLFKRRKKQEEDGAQERLTVGQALRKERFKQGNPNIEDVTEQLGEFCTQYENALDSKLEAEQEYEAVLSYLTDIQMLDELPLEQRREAEEFAGNIIRLNEERIHFQEKEQEGISPARFLQMERYEKEVEASLKTLKEQEQYREIINRDVRNLEGEKGVIAYEREEAQKQLQFFKKLSIALVLIVCAIFIGLMYLMQHFEVTLMIPVLVTGTLALALAAYIITAVRKLRHIVAVAEAKNNRAIQLLNKVKIKYVNCTNLLDYLYEKFHVNNAQELHYHWQEYMRIVEEERRFKKTAESIDFYTEEIIRELKKNGISDAAVWGYQIEALVDPKEMVEVRHRLNVRRQKLRQRIDYNNNQEEMARKSLRAFRERHVAYDSETLLVLAKNEVEL